MLDDKEKEVFDKRLNNLLRHQDNVRSDTLLLGQRLIESGQEDLGLTLISNGQIHDNSKFSGIEWEYLNSSGPIEDSEKDLFVAAIQQHIKTNAHHPEFWSGIKNMPQVYLAEMVCDVHSRSSEQGTDLVEWIKDKATDKYGFTVSSRVYKDLRKYIQLLLERKF